MAAIDLGTNTTLMLVAEVDVGGALTKLEDLAAITRLGRGVDRSRRLDPAAVQGTLQVLQQYQRRAEHWGAAIVAVGTSALRDADNRDEFLAPARAILGPNVDVISGDREAELTFKGALEGIEVPTDRLMVVDIGGGSTELVSGHDQAIQGRVSLNIGSVRMHERYALSAPVTSAQEDCVRLQVATQLGVAEWSPSSTLIATAATATTLAAMHLGLRSYDPARVHGMRLTASELTFQVRRLLETNLEDRRRMAGLDSRRADVIAVGGLILDEIVKWSGCRSVTVSDGGVRCGLAREALENFGR